MRHIQAPDESPIGAGSVFLGGGITGCWDWQGRVLDELAGSELTLVNPRRSSWNMDAGKEESERQIEWEFRRMRDCHAIMFWFPAGSSPCPIALYELGYWLGSDSRRLYVGREPEYVRWLDLDVQVGLLGRMIPVYDDLHELCRAMGQRETTAFKIQIAAGNRDKPF